MTNDPMPISEKTHALLDKTGKLVVLSILWSVCSLPIFTIGASSCALYDCILYDVRQESSEPVWKRFFRVFRRDFRLATGVTVFYILFFLALLFIDLLLAAVSAVYAGNSTLPVLHLIYRALWILPACSACWLFPLLDRFKLSRKQLRVNAWKLTFQQMAPSAIMVLMVALAAFAVCRLYFIPLLILPALVSLACSFITEHIFVKYEAGNAPIGNQAPAAPVEPTKETQPKPDEPPFCSGD